MEPLPDFLCRISGSACGGFGARQAKAWPSSFCFSETTCLKRRVCELVKPQTGPGNGAGNFRVTGKLQTVTGQGTPGRACTLSALSAASLIPLPGLPSQWLLTPGSASHFFVSTACMIVGVGGGRGFAQGRCALEGGRAGVLPVRAG